MKKVRYAITFFVEDEVLDDYTDENARFFFEENHCVANQIRALAATLKEGECSECIASEVKMCPPNCGHAKHIDITRAR